MSLEHLTFIQWIEVIAGLLLFAYLIGRAFANGISSGIEKFLNKHFDKYNNFKKEKNDDKTSK